MKNIACQLEHSVEAEVSPSFAWSWRTDIRNWDDPPAQFQLDGPFAANKEPPDAHVTPPPLSGVKSRR